MNEEDTRNLMGLQDLGLASQDLATKQAQQSFYMQEQERSLTETQLEIESILINIYRLLRQDKIIIDEVSGRITYEPLTSLQERTFSDKGIQRIMEVIHFYVNKNNLLSNYDEKRIDNIMLRFVRELNALILLKYEIIFRQPTFEECKDILLKRIEDKKKLKLFALEILGKNTDKEVENLIEQDLLDELEVSLEKEMTKVREEQRKEKLREYGMIMAQIEAIVYATYNRALRGEERGSLRRHTQISEILGKPMTPQKTGLFGGLFK